MIEEVFLSGFCKAQNQGRTVLCEYETGTKERPGRFLEADCAFPDCPFSRECLIFRQAPDGMPIV